MSTSSQRKDSTQRLCQNQVETLVKAMQSVDAGQTSNTSVECDESASFTVDPELLSAVGELHQSAATKLAESLSLALRTEVGVHVQSVQPRCAETASLAKDDLGWRSLLTPEATVGDWQLDLSSRLCCVMVDRMLGGDPAHGETSDRPMTEIERRLMQRLVDQLLELLRDAWRPVADLRWIVRHQDTEPTSQSVNQCVLIDFAVTLCNNHGNIRLHLPVSTMQHYQGPLLSRCWNRNDEEQPRSRPADNIAGAPIDVVATIAHSNIATSDLLGLSVGDIIATEKGVHQALELSIQGVPKFHVRAGSLKGNKAIQIESGMEKEMPEDRSPDAPSDEAR